MDRSQHASQSFRLPGSTTLTLYKGPRYPRLAPGALRQALARHHIPALVTMGTFCRSRPGAPGFDKVVNASSLADGSAKVITGQAMPSGTQLSNPYRRHSSLGMLSPAEYERRHHDGTPPAESPPVSGERGEEHCCTTGRWLTA
jgi:hypothetical protein